MKNMSVLGRLSEFEADYEAQFGEKPSHNLIDFMFRVEGACKKFERRGREDAANGFATCGEETFVGCLYRIFSGDMETAEVIGRLLWESYMDGYGSEREVVCLCSGGPS